MQYRPRVSDLLQIVSDQGKAPVHVFAHFFGQTLTGAFQNIRHLLADLVCEAPAFFRKPESHAVPVSALLFEDAFLLKNSDCPGDISLVPLAKFGQLSYGDVPVCIGNGDEIKGIGSFQPVPFISSVAILFQE